MFFRNRTDAGRDLSGILSHYFDSPSTVVVGLVRGGAVIALEVADRLNLPLDLLVVRKLGYPDNPEFALAAVTAAGDVASAWDNSGIDRDWYERELARLHFQAQELERIYLVGRPRPNVHGKTVLLVDDGIATGLTVRAAIAELQRRGAAKIVIAAPVIPKEVARELTKYADEVDSILTPKHFLGSVGSYYTFFPQVTDDEVVQILKVADQREKAEMMG